MWWPHGDAREKGRVITARRERPGLTSAGSPLLQPFHPADHGDLSSLICAGPARLLLESVCPFQPGCGFGSERPDCCHLNGSCLCLPKPCAPTITPSLPWASLAVGLWGGVSTPLGCSWSCSPISSSLLHTGTSQTCRTQAGFIQAELAALPSSWQGGKLQQDKREGHNPAMAD